MRANSPAYRVFSISICVGVVLLLCAGDSFADRPDTAWTWVYGGSQFDAAKDVQPTYDGGYIVVGSTVSFGAGGKDVLLVKLDAGGDTTWTRTYGYASDDEGFSVLEVSSGVGYMVVGKTQTFGGGGDDVWLLRMAPDCTAGLPPHPADGTLALRGAPNPFRDLVLIEYGLHRPAHIRLALYDVSGRKVRSLADHAQDAGMHTQIWDGKDESGRDVTNGLYLLRFEAEGRSATKKLLLVR